MDHHGPQLPGGVPRLPNKLDNHRHQRIIPHSNRAIRVPSQSLSVLRPQHLHSRLYVRVPLHLHDFHASSFGKHRCK